MSRQGYHVLNLRENNKSQIRMVHALVADAFLGPKPARHWVRHKNRNALDDRSDNLHYVSAVETSRDTQRMYEAAPLVDVPAGLRQGRSWKTCIYRGELFDGYQVSDLGDVYRVRPYRGRQCGGIVSTASPKSRYPRVYLGRPGGKHIYACVHALVAEAFLGERPPGYVINHLDGDKRNNRAANLEYCTQCDNNAHAIAMGLRTFNNIRGERAPGGVLSETQARMIRHLTHSSSFHTYQIAEAFGVSVGTVQDIKARRSWVHLSENQVKDYSGSPRSLEVIGT